MQVPALGIRALTSTGRSPLRPPLPWRRRPANPPAHAPAAKQNRAAAETRAAGAIVLNGEADVKDLGNGASVFEVYVSENVVFAMIQNLLFSFYPKMH